jgi:acyl-CoA synthetase (NDP forming)
VPAQATHGDDSPDERRRLSQALFAPPRIALIGASPDPGKLTSRPLRVLQRHGYAGDVRTFPAVSGEHADALRGVDHALIMTPATAVTQAIEVCGAAGIGVATVLTAGFAELGTRGRRRQEALLAAARSAGVRILGPNSLGVVNVTGRVALSANAVFERGSVLPGGLSLISQSGSMLGAIVTRAHEHGIGFSKLVAVGNECDLATGELVDLLVDDPETRAILLFLEALRDAPRLAAAARRAYAAGKPVVAYKIGRSATTRALAWTHTGALVDEHEHAKAFFRAHGILRADMLETLFELPALVLGHRPAARHRLATLTVSGGGAAMVLDGLSGHPVDMVAPPPDVIARLGAQSIRCAPEAPVIDLPMGRADHGAYAATLATLLDSDHCDMVLAVQGSNAAYVPHSVHERVLAVGMPRKPLAVFMGPQAAEATRILQQHGVAAFRTPEACADALRAYAEWRAPAAAVPVDDAARTGIAEAIRALPRGPLNEFEAGRLLHAIGIEVAASEVVQRPEDLAGVGFPVAAKVLSRAVVHKSDVGGVILDIATPADLARAIERLGHNLRTNAPHADLEGVLVQPMHHGVAEVLVGYRRSQEAGPIVMLGLGGRYAELATERAVRCAPIGLDEAQAMIEELPAMRILRGYRGGPTGDVAALARVLHAMSLLALVDDPAVVEAEINPLVVKTRGAVAVDALVRTDSAGR